MVKIKLGDICEVLNGYAFKSEQYVESGIRVIRIANVQKGYIEDSLPAFYPVDTQGIERYMLKEEDLLISLTGNVGRVALLNKTLLPAALNQRVACLRIKRNDVLKKYLFHFLNSNLFEQRCMQASKGVAQKNMSTEWLKDYEIPVCTIEEQNKIISILDKANDIILNRKKQIYQLDELIKSRFIEMFGDPVLNPKNWKRISFKEGAIKLSDGPFGSNLKSEHYRNTGVRIIRLQNIGVGKFIDDDKAYVSKEHYKKIDKYTCYPDEIVIGTMGTPNLRACIVPKYIDRAIHKADCVRLVPKAELLNNIFVCQYINCPETLVLASDKIHGQTRSRISSGQVAQLPIYVPPIELQNQFSDFVQQVDKQKVIVQQSLEEIQTLFDSLMQKYFG